MLSQKSKNKLYRCHLEKKYQRLFINSGVDLKSDHKEDLLHFEELGNLNNYIKWFYDNGGAFIDVDADEHKEDNENYNSCDASDICAR